MNKESFKILKGKKAILNNSKGIICGFIKDKCFIMAVVEGVNGWPWNGKADELTIKNNKKGYLFVHADNIVELKDFKIK